jgi:hypothetical protein
VAGSQDRDGMNPSGPQLFARFAYPPNALGYCGPPDPRALLEQATAPSVDAGLRAAAVRFEGAWPYLQLIAAAAGLDDPLDRRVVEAYWVGNDLLDRVDARLLLRSLDDRFGPRVGHGVERLSAPVVLGARPHHNFHVFAVYPWLGLIRSGTVDKPLEVLDHCRIRWGRVEAVLDDRVVVTSRPVRWDGHAVVLGEARREHALASVDGLSLAPQLTVGDWCALHWDWVCARLSLGQVVQLSRWTDRVLTAVNSTPYPAPAAVLS